MQLGAEGYKLNIAKREGILAGSLAMGLGVALGFSAQLTERALLLGSSALLIVMIMGVFARDVFLGRFSVLDLKFYVLLGFLCFVGFGSIQTVVSGAYRFYGPDTLWKSVALTYVGFFAFLFGYELAGNTGLRWPPFLWRRYSKSVISYFAFAITLLAIVGTLARFKLYGGITDFALTAYYLKHSSGTIESAYKFLSRMYVPSAVFLVCFAVDRESSTGKKILSIVGLLLFFVFCSVQGSRGGIVQLCIVMGSTLLVFWKDAFRRISVYMVPIVIAAFLVILVQSKYRHAPGLVLSSEGDVVSYSVEEFLFNFNAYSHLLTVLDNFPDNLDFTWGRSFFNIATNFVPRSLWNGKPVAFGRFLAVEIYGTPETVSYTGTILGESYVNGSWPGVVFVLSCLGLGARVFYNTFSKHRENVLLAVWYIALMWPFFFIVRGDLLSAVFPALGIFVTMYLVFILVVGVSKLFPNRANTRCASIKNGKPRYVLPAI